LFRELEDAFEFGKTCIHEYLLKGGGLARVRCHNGHSHWTDENDVIVVRRVSTLIGMESYTVLALRLTAGRSFLNKNVISGLSAPCPQ